MNNITIYLVLLQDITSMSSFPIVNIPTEVQHKKKKDLFFLTGYLSGFQSVSHGLSFDTKKFVTFNIRLKKQQKVTTDSLVQKARNMFLYLLMHFSQSSLIEGLGPRKRKIKIHRI